jgi:nucleoside-diphosphate-sugar epimerase
MSKHIVVGAGPIGTATALLLAERGEEVVVATRSGSGPTHPAITRATADASSSADMIEITQGAVAIYNCANPAYHRWPTDWPPIAQALLAAAERSNAVLVTASNLYGYGPVSGPSQGPLTEDLPLNAQGPEAGRVRATEVRASDYIGTGAQSHLGERVVPRLLAGRNVTVMKSADSSHSWTATDDVARLMVTVAADERAWGRPWHVPSNPPRTQREAVGDLCRVAGVQPVSVREYPAMAIAGMGLFNPMMREIPEVAYQFKDPFVLDSTDAQRTFGLAPTPWDEVLSSVIASFAMSRS